MSRITPPRTLPPAIAATLLDPTETPRPPRGADGRRHEIQWRGPHWTEVDLLTGEILAEGTIEHAGDVPPHVAREVML